MRTKHHILSFFFLTVGLAICNGSTALAQSCGSGNFCAYYYDNRGLEGQHVELREQDAPIDINWSKQHPLTQEVCTRNCNEGKSSGPGPVYKKIDYGVGSDNFSIRFVGAFYLPGGDYDFVVGSDDGLRLFLDGNLIIDRWIDRSYTEDRFRLQISPGNHEIRLDYYENGSDARVRLHWYRN